VFGIKGGQGISPSLTPSLAEDLEDHLDLGFAVLTSKWTGEGFACDEVVVDLIYYERMFTHVIKGFDEDHLPGFEVSFIHGGYLP
jgi:hypothetical protein